MICHVCGEQAIGQCKTCNRFYCRLHGNITCVACSEGVQETPNRAVNDWDVQLPNSGDNSPPSPLGRMNHAGATCTWCRRTASGACTVCGRFYCADHYGGKWRLSHQWPQLAQRLCHVCKRRVEEERRVDLKFIVIWLLIAAVLLVMGCILWQLKVVR
jgi:hypothetical protein